MSKEERKEREREGEKGKGGKSQAPLLRTAATPATILPKRAAREAPARKGRQRHQCQISPCSFQVRREVLCKIKVEVHVKVKVI
jgi:hypothetical protein